ncbi:MAG TPA: DUF1800 domain-containing protein [Fimbriimonadaceae bacterium]|nr:DUF1800 domain-containing protein [Fimbriimonadaceae bacterium]
MAVPKDQAKIAHLLRRFGLGASEAEIDFYGKDGIKGAVDRLLDYEDLDEGFDVEPSVFSNPKNGVVNMRGMQLWWYLRLSATRHPFEQKMTVFWHDHFATSAAKVDVPEAMYNYVETLRQNATGTFGDLLTKISKNQAMLYWLDNNENIKGTANENFAREVMELFTLGVDDGYTENDIREIARAFTGWAFGIKRGGRVIPTQKPNRNTVFLSIPARHDDGEKTIFGKTGDYNGDDVLAMLIANPNTAHYITKKIWEWFVYPNPSNATVDEYAKKWIAANLDTKELVRAIANSDEFYSDKARRAVVKNPIDFCVSAWRSLGIGEAVMDRVRSAGADQNTRRFAGSAGVLESATKAMGMELMYPPDVSGWVSGEEWISTGSMVERIKFADRLFGAQSRGILALAMRDLPVAGSTPEAVVDRLLSVFDADLPKKKVQILYEAAKDNSSGPLTPANIEPTLDAVTRLIFGSPEFQFN